MNEMQEFHQELLNKDYPVGFDEDNQNNRLYHIVLITRQYAYNSLVHSHSIMWIEGARQRQLLVIGLKAVNSMQFHIRPI